MRITKDAFKKNYPGLVKALDMMQEENDSACIECCDDTSFDKFMRSQDHDLGNVAVASTWLATLSEDALRTFCGGEFSQVEAMVNCAAAKAARAFLNDWFESVTHKSLAQ